MTVSTEEEPTCFSYIPDEHLAYSMTNDEIDKGLENGLIERKIECLNALICKIMTGQRLSKTTLMRVIRFLVPLQHHELKRLMLIFWEVVPKLEPNGKLITELILICDAITKDLNHANEYIRGSTLRFMCKLKEFEIVQQVVPAVLKCLTHNHPYVRRNAVMAVSNIYKTFPTLIPHAPSTILEFLENDGDSSCKRNALLSLAEIDENATSKFIKSISDQVSFLDSSFQLAVLHVISKLSDNKPNEKPQYLKCATFLLESRSKAVKFQACELLLSLSSSSNLLQVVTQCLVELVTQEYDGNARLVVLDRIIAIINSEDCDLHVIQPMCVVLLQVLSSSGDDVILDFGMCKKILTLSQRLLSDQNCDEACSFLCKELSRVQKLVGNQDKPEQSKAGESVTYMEMIVDTLELCLAISSKRLSEVLNILVSSLFSEFQEKVAARIAIFLHNLFISVPSCRNEIKELFFEILPTLTRSSIFGHAVFVMSIYVQTAEDVERFLNILLDLIGPVDELLTKLTDGVDVRQIVVQPIVKTRVVVDEDNTYREEVCTEMPENDRQSPNLFFMLVESTGHLSARVSRSVSNVIYNVFDSISSEEQNRLKAKAMLIIFKIVSILRCEASKSSINADSKNVVSECIVNLQRDSRTIMQSLRESQFKSENVFTNIIQKSQDSISSYSLNQYSSTFQKPQVNADDVISFLGNETYHTSKQENYQNQMQSALGKLKRKIMNVGFANPSKLNRVFQLTGMSDHIYAEAMVNVTHSDIVMEGVLVNQTQSTFTDIRLEIFCTNDHRLVESTVSSTLLPLDFCNFRICVKVSPAIEGFIFGDIAYRASHSATEFSFVYLREYEIDIGMFIVPHSMPMPEFREKWSVLDWEARFKEEIVKFKDFKSLVKAICEHTKMVCLDGGNAATVESPENSDNEVSVMEFCDFHVVNLCSKTVFNDNILLNASMEYVHDDEDGSTKIKASFIVRCSNRKVTCAMRKNIYSVIL